jgi:F-type H+-transporting ATPase subunit delta
VSQSAVAVRYAEALIEAAQEKNALDAVSSDVEGLLNLLRESEDLAQFVADPMMRSDQKQRILSNLFKGKVNDLTCNFLVVLCQNRRERLLKEILAGFITVLDDRQGIAKAQVTSATPLTSEQEEKLAARLSAFSGKKVNLETTIDASLKAGFVARLGDQVFDSTLATQLKRMQRQLVSGV